MANTQSHQARYRRFLDATKAHRYRASQASDAEELIHHRLAEVAGGATGHDPATLHRVVAIGLPHEVQMLLDEQHTDSRLSNDPLHRRLDVLNDVRLNPLGGLIEQQQLGLAEQGPGNRQLLLLPPTEITALRGRNS